MNFLHEENRIYCEQDNKIIAELLFPLTGEDTVTITKTFVDNSLRGQGVAGKLMEEFIKIAKERNLKLIPQCSYALHWFEKHSEYKNLLR